MSNNELSNGILVGHPFYLPTQVVLLDDDPDFLDGISLMLNKNTSYKLFQSASAALKHVNDAHRHVGFLQRCYTSYKTGPLDSDTLLHIDVGKLHHEVLNGLRFQTCSTVIVDYSMPEMSGLEFLRNLTNPFVRKVLLTGQADMELAIKAFNQQIIDQFIDKHDPRLKQKLNATIMAFQDQYFRNSFKLLTDPLLATNEDAFLINREFQEYFAQLREQIGCVEYYMIESPHTGFLLVNNKGKAHCLLIYTQETLAEHHQLLKDLKAPPELIKDVGAGLRIPTYNTIESEISRDSPYLQDWRKHYAVAREIRSPTHTYYTTLCGVDALPDVAGQTLFSYEDFLESNNDTGSQIMH
jgi:FixJ family two-component response regulator